MLKTETKYDQRIDHDRRLAHISMYFWEQADRTWTRSLCGKVYAVDGLCSLEESPPFPQCVVCDDLSLGLA